MKALVLGGSGFIGSHIVDVLLAQGHSVRVFARARERFRHTPSEVEFIQGNFDDPKALTKALAGIDQVFHLVSTTVPATSNLDPVADIHGNLIATVRLLELMRAEGVRRLVYLSSGGTVYGIPQIDPIPESHPLNPLTAYGITKVAIENHVRMERHLHGLDYAILRASNPYGPRQGHSGVQGVIGTFLWRLYKKNPIQIWGNGSIVRDFIYVKDLARACVGAAEKQTVGTFNVGYGEGHSISQIVTIIEKLTNLTFKKEYSKQRGFDVPRNVLDISKIRNSLGWKPEVEITKGIYETWKWLREKDPFS